MNLRWMILISSSMSDRTLPLETFIPRYRNLDRQFIERRLQEEQSAMAALTNLTFPIHFAPPKTPIEPSMLGGTP